MVGNDFVHRNSAAIRRVIGFYDGSLHGAWATAPNSMTILRTVALITVVALLWAGGAQSQAAPGRVLVKVTGADQRGIGGAHVELRAGGAVTAAADTDAEGNAVFNNVGAGVSYDIVASKQGFDPALKSGVVFAGGAATNVDIVLNPAAAHHDSVDVRATAEPEAGSAPSSIATQTAKELPSRPATVAEALPLIPGVVRSPEGGLRISGAGEHRSAMIVNSADVTDPATGQFGVTVPIDSVETLKVYQTPFLAEYGRFTAGLVSVETRRGGDRWKWELNDPFPDFRIRSWDMRGIKDATPRLNFEGPLIRGKLYFSEGLEYDIRKIEVYTLPFPENQKKQEGVNSFSQLDWILSAKHFVTATLHAAPERLQYVNLDAFNPEQTVPDAANRNYTGTVADHLVLGGGILENTISTTQFNTRVWGQGGQDLMISPQGNSGNYFAQQSRNASRLGWSSTYSFPTVNALGSHDIKAGSYLAGSWDRGEITNHPIDILNAADAPLERITFAGGRPFQMTDLDYAFFVQDHWLPTPHIAVDYGVRSESQAISEALRLAPRIGVSWSPNTGTGTVISAGFGWFYDRVPLNVYAFNHYPNELITMYNGAGATAAGPLVYQNILGEVPIAPPLVFQEQTPGNFSPRSTTWAMKVEQPLTRFVRLRASFMENDSSGLVVLNTMAPDPLTNIGAYALSGTGRSRYRQFETTASVRLGGERQLFLSYVRSRARGDLNDFSSYVGAYPMPVIRPNQFSNLPADLPNRFLLWGLVKLPLGFRIAPVAEYHTGFPYLVTDAAQNYVGAPYGNRFPSFLSIDSRVSKDFKVSPKYTLRFSVSAFNLTDHFNPEAVHANVADPAYGFFFGQRSRRYTADFDVLF